RPRRGRIRQCVAGCAAEGDGSGGEGSTEERSPPCRRNRHVARTRLFGRERPAPPKALRPVSLHTHAVRIQSRSMNASSGRAHGPARSTTTFAKNPCLRQCRLRAAMLPRSTWFAGEPQSAGDTSSDRRRVNVKFFRNIRNFGATYNLFEHPFLSWRVAC